jgi:hypothetical protein
MTNFDQIGMMQGLLVNNFDTRTNQSKRCTIPAMVLLYLYSFRVRAKLWCLRVLRGMKGNIDYFDGFT